MKKRQAKQRDREQQLNDEKAALMCDRKLQMWVKLAQEDVTPEAVCLRTRPVLARAFVRSLYSHSAKEYEQLGKCVAVFAMDRKT
jgi:hypothetical protein